MQTLRNLILTAVLSLLTLGDATAQTARQQVEVALRTYFQQYTAPTARIGTCKLDRFNLDTEHRRLTVFTNVNFAYQPFTEEIVDDIYRTLKERLPQDYRKYAVTIIADGKSIDALIPNAYRQKTDRTRLYGKLEHKGDPWVSNESRAWQADKGLDGRHLVVWQSHGKVFKQAKNRWEWQRPRLYGTSEDLLTQSFVLPYLIPMLQQAGAIVYTPRERDTQRHEVIVDNDRPSAHGRYLEQSSKKSAWQAADGKGFAQLRAVYADKQNPFQDGTARQIDTESKPDRAFAQWVPDIPEAGEYAVYVSYKTVAGSVSDAHYTVFHQGGTTELRVNQQMGGGTWVYLGTYQFAKGQSATGMVVLSNESKQRGVVTADAVRFGGGMGNIARGGTTSGLPRYLEGARYTAQWSGFPYDVYSSYEGANDYNDDINARGRAVNYLTGGSVFNPDEKGLGVPVELCMALHTDAGYTPTDSDFVGTLGIYTTAQDNGLLASGLSRLASRDLADMVITGLQRDLSAFLGTDWARRSLWNRNYSESRVPTVPAFILELLAHQNFADIRQAHDPRFKFAVGRSVYKSILRYVATMHGTDYVVQPLPVERFMVTEGSKKHTFRLAWKGVNDPLEPTAKPQHYVVYVRTDDGGWDNGTLVRGTDHVFTAQPGHRYSFRVTAANRGGESFPSETLSAYEAPNANGTVLIINGFTRLSGPAVVQTDSQQGFLLDQDPGVPYLYSSSFCGPQQNFARSGLGKDDEAALGYSGGEWEGMRIAGNTFDYPALHGRAIASVGGYSYVSCSLQAALAGRIRLADYEMVDYLTGVQLNPYPAEVENLLIEYCSAGGRLMVSGSHTGSGTANVHFVGNVLRCKAEGDLWGDPSGELFGADTTFRIPRTVNEQTVGVPKPDCLTALAPAYTAFVYTPSRYSAGVAYKGHYRTFTLGFPFEAIQGQAEQRRVMQAIMGFLMN
jgi:hypothetical protein